MIKEFHCIVSWVLVDLVCNSGMFDLKVIDLRIDTFTSSFNHTNKRIKKRAKHYNL